MSQILSLVRLGALLLATSLPLAAEPTAYVLDTGASRVGFEVRFGPDRITGTIPVRDAEVLLDFDRVSNSVVSVSLDAAGAVANFPFATQALRGPKVLGARDFPTLRFRSTGVRADGAGARIDGDITIRDVTRPIVLDAQLFRPGGQEAGDRSRLSIRLRGSVSRRAFGADGWSNLVGDEVALDISVWVDRAG